MTHKRRRKPAPKDEHPRKRLLEYGARALSDAELVGPLKQAQIADRIFIEETDRTGAGVLLAAGGA